MTQEWAAVESSTRRSPSRTRNWRGQSDIVLGRAAAVCPYCTIGVSVDGQRMGRRLLWHSARLIHRVYIEPTLHEETHKMHHSLGSDWAPMQVDSQADPPHTGAVASDSNGSIVVDVYCDLHGIVTTGLCRSVPFFERQMRFARLCRMKLWANDGAKRVDVRPICDPAAPMKVVDELQLPFADPVDGVKYLRPGLFIGEERVRNHPLLGCILLTCIHVDSIDAVPSKIARMSPADALQQFVSLCGESDICGEVCRVCCNQKDSEQVVINLILDVTQLSPQVFGIDCASKTGSVWRQLRAARRRHVQSASFVEHAQALNALVLECAALVVEQLEEVYCIIVELPIDYVETIVSLEDSCFRKGRIYPRVSMRIPHKLAWQAPQIESLVGELNGALDTMGSYERMQVQVVLFVGRHSMTLGERVQASFRREEERCKALAPVIGAVMDVLRARKGLVRFIEVRVTSRQLADYCTSDADVSRLGSRSSSIDGSPVASWGTDSSHDHLWIDEHLGERCENGAVDLSGVRGNPLSWFR